MVEKVVKTVKVPAPKSEEWQEYIDETPEINNVSHLIRLSVEKEMSGEYDVSQRRAEGESSEIGGEVLTHLRRVETTINDVEERLTALEGLESANKAYDLKRAVYAVLPSHPYEPDGIRDSDILEFPTPEDVARTLGADDEAVEEVLEELDRDTGQVHSAIDPRQHDGPMHFWKSGDGLEAIL